MGGLSRKRRFLGGALIALAIGTLFCLMTYFNLFHRVQLQSGDLLYRAASLQEGAQPSEKIAIIAIDDKSLEQLGHFASWPRSYHARLIDLLAQGGARTVVFDILFSEPTADDELMATSIKHAGNVILPLICTMTVRQPTSTEKTITFEEPVKPLKSFEENALAVGHANVFTDEDGIVRRLPLVIPDDERYEPALALAAVAKYLRRSQVLESPVYNDSLPFAGRSISLDSTSSMLINYTGGSPGISRFEIISYVDVLTGNIAPAHFQDKIVLIGATATGMGDTFWTPMGWMVHGVELHASAIQTILTGNFLTPAPSWVTMLSIIILALLCGLAALLLRPLYAILSATFLCITYFLISFSFFDGGRVFNILYPPLAIAGAFVGVTVFNVVSEQSEKMQVTKIFGRYVSPSVVDRILTASGEGELKLGGEKQEVTVMFADARGFTGISEIMQPEDLVRVLNTYLSTIIRAVLKYEGMVNKFGGDSVMAVWNVPVDCKEHALSAVKAALAAQHAIKELHDKETTLPRMEFGIGINTGEAVAGNMGAQDRLEYSVVSDSVNVAARLADATPGGRVWVGANTYALAKDYVKARLLEPLAVKGKREPVQAYEIWDTQNSQIVDLARAVKPQKESVMSHEAGS